MIGMFMASMQPLMSVVPVNTTREHVSDVQTALVNYLQKNGTFPCPAPLTDAPEDATFGLAVDCTTGGTAGVIRTATGRPSADGTQFVRIGTIPVRTLDLPVSDMTDGWGNRLVYAVTEKVATPGGFKNENGGIYMQDAGGKDVTSQPGNVLYTIVSMGPDGNGAYSRNGTQVSPCAPGVGDTENCDSDAVFLNTDHSEGEFAFDDIVQYRSFMDQVLQPTCGNKGMIYAPGHPEADKDKCLDPGYKPQNRMTLTGNYSVNCPQNGTSCQGPWVNMSPDQSLQPGDYMIDWNAYMRFDYAQLGEYAIVEFRVDNEDGSVIKSSQNIPFMGALCQAPGTLQNPSGLMELHVDQKTPLYMRIVLFGGEYDSTQCGGQPPALRLVEVGQGDISSKRTISVEAFRKPQTF